MRTFWPEMAGHAKEAHNLLLLHLKIGFHRAALAKDHIHVVGHAADVVKLQQVQVVSLQQSK